MARATVESSLVLNIHRIVKSAAGAQRFDGSVHWASGANIKIAVALHAERSGVLTLDFTCNGQAVMQDIYLEAQPRHYGGLQWYGECPRTHERVAKLYLPPGATRFLSRRAYRLAYAIQNESRIGRHCARRWKIIRAKLKSDLPDDWPKPKWMRWRTYDRITEQLAHHDQFWFAAMAGRIERLTRGLERSRRRRRRNRKR